MPISSTVSSDAPQTKSTTASLIPSLSFSTSPVQPTSMSAISSTNGNCSSTCIKTSQKRLLIEAYYQTMKCMARAYVRYTDMSEIVYLQISLQRFDPLSMPSYKKENNCCNMTFARFILRSELCYQMDN